MFVDDASLMLLMEEPSTCDEDEEIEKAVLQSVVSWLKIVVSADMILFVMAARFQMYCNGSVVHIDRSCWIFPAI